MRDPATSTDILSAFTFTGTISEIVKNPKIVCITVFQCVAGRLPTEYKVIIPVSALVDGEFPYIQGDTVLIQDALMYEKNAEVRFRIDSIEQMKSTSADPGTFNALSFTGKIVEIRKEKGCTLAVMEQNVRDHFKTSVEVMFLDSVEMDEKPKVGDIGFIHSALLYEKDGSYRARLGRPDLFKVLYTPDAVMCLGTVEAKEEFC